MFCSKCGITKKSKNALVQHEIKCKLSEFDVSNIIDDYVSKLLSMKQLSEKYKVSSSFLFGLLGDKTRSKKESSIISHKKSPRKLTETTKSKISSSIKEYLNKNPEKRKWIENESKPSLVFKKLLFDNNISYVEEYRPLEDRFFSIDIAFPDRKIGIEINGQQHYDIEDNLKDYYKKRHDLIESSGWTLYEIKSNLIFKSDFIDEFIFHLKNNFDFGYKDYKDFLVVKRENTCRCNLRITRNAKFCVTCFRENRLSFSEIESRLDLIKEVDFTKLGWIKQVSEILNISHTQTKRFIKKYYNGTYYERKRK